MPADQLRYRRRRLLVVMIYDRQTRRTREVRTIRLTPCG